MHPALERLPRGWFHHGEQVLALVEQHRPRIVVELGTHDGASATAMARVMAAWGGVIYCVDTWCGVPKPGRGLSPLRIFQCAHNLRVAGVSPRVRLIPATTADAAESWGGPVIDFLYVDADHSYAGVKQDLALWVPHVRPGGLIAGDDYDHPKYPGVNQAWDEFEATRGIPLTRVLSPQTTPPNMRLVYGTLPMKEN